VRPIQIPKNANFGPAGACFFLVVVDESDELKLALRYGGAPRSAHAAAGLPCSSSSSRADLQQWAAVETLMREEQREQAEALLHIKLSG